MTRHYYHENEDALRKAVAAIPSLHGSDVAVTMPKPTTQPAMADQAQVQSTASAFQDISQISPDMMDDLRRIYSVLENIFGKLE